MPLNTIVHDPAIVQIGNAATIGGNNLPYRSTLFTSFNYTITNGDYFAGSVQFCTVVRLILSLNNAARWIQYRDDNPRRYGLGSYSWESSSGITRRGAIDSLAQSLVSFSRIISLSRNESARPKLSVLSARPRLLISKSLTEGMDIDGSFLPTGGQWNGSGTIVGATPGVINILGGFGGLPAASTDAAVAFPRRQMIFDSTDGILNCTTTPEGQNWYEKSQFNNLGDRMHENSANIFLEPGITGTAKVTVYKCGEIQESNDSPHSIYTSGNLPLV